jgi:hypothetical protein
LAKKNKIAESDLSAILKAEIANCDGAGGSALSNDRVENLDRYFGRPYGTEQEGRSSVVIPDVRDAVEWVVATLMRIFTSGEKIAEFDPEEESDIEGAKQATEYTNFVWNRDNPGFTNTLTWFKDGLISKLGTLKIYYNKIEKTKRERFAGLDDEAFAKVVNDPEVTVSEHTENEIEVIVPDLRPNQPPQLLKQKTHDLVITRTQKVGRVCVDTVPPEEYLVSKDARTNVEARLEGHKRKRTVSDLIEDGYDRDKVEAIASGNEAPTDQEEIARDTVQENTGSETVPLNKAMREIWVYECYIKVDVDGDGIAEMRQVTAAGPGYTILKDEAWDAPKPFVNLTPIPLPHRLIGLSMADITKIWQLIRTTIFRQYLDNLYLSNNQREEVEAARIVDPDEVMSSKPGQKIRTKGGPGPAIIPIVVPQIGAAALEGMSYSEQLKENATGVSARTQGLGSNTLHDTLGGEQMLMTAAMGKIELIARVYAEAMKDAFRLIHKLNCMYQDKPRMIRLTGEEFVPMDPSQWNADMDMTVSVGIGTGDKQLQMQAATMIGQAQSAAHQSGLLTITPDNAMATAEMIVNAAGQKGAERFFSLPDPNAPKPPDPEMAKVMAKAEADKAALQQKGQLQQESQQQDFQLSMTEMEKKFQLEMIQMREELEMKWNEILIEASLEKRRIDQQPNIEGIRSHAKIASKVNMGGDPG